MDLLGVAAIITSIAGLAGAIGLKIRDDRRAQKKVVRRKLRRPRRLHRRPRPRAEPKSSPENPLLWAAMDDLSARLTEAEAQIGMLKIDARERRNERAPRSRRAVGGE